MTDSFDVVIVGAGASELAHDLDLRVLLLESGPTDRSHLIHMPGGIAKLLTPGSAHLCSHKAGKGPRLSSEDWLKGRTPGGRLQFGQRHGLLERPAFGIGRRGHRRL